MLGERQLKPGDEVITVATGFPTTVNPIFQNNLVPVFVDVDIPTYNIDVTQLEAALSPKTRAVMIAHTLGNPFDLDAVTAFCKRHNLWLIEDCCDAVGATYNDQPVGRFGDVATVSFYPAHHITMGEGGAVLTDKPKLKKLIESFRDWGRDCWCDPGKENTCGKRFDWQLGRIAARLRSQVHLFAYRLQLESHRYAGRSGRFAIKETAGLHPKAPREFQLFVSKVERAAGFLYSSAGDAQLESILVRLSDLRPTGSGFHTRRGCPLAGGSQDRHAAVVRRQPHPTARVPKSKIPRGGRSQTRRRGDAARLLDRGVSRLNHTRCSIMLAIC